MGTVGEVTRAVRTKSGVLVAVVVTVCVLLAGCASGPTLPGPAGPDSAVPANEATPQQTDSAKTVDMTDPASCLVGTWQQDLKVFTEDAIKEIVKRGGSSNAKVRWGGGAFLRFDHEDMFFVWTEDATFESWSLDSHSRSVTNGSAFGDYVVDAGLIHWSNYSTLSLESVTYENDVLVDGFSTGHLHVHERQA